MSHPCSLCCSIFNTKDKKAQSYSLCSVYALPTKGLLLKHLHLAHKKINIRQLTFENLLMLFSKINRLPLTAFVVGSVFFFHRYFFSWVIFSFKIIFRMFALIHHVYNFVESSLLGTNDFSRPSIVLEKNSFSFKTSIFLEWSIKAVKNYRRHTGQSLS